MTDRAPQADRRRSGLALLLGLILVIAAILGYLAWDRLTPRETPVAVTEARLETPSPDGGTATPTAPATSMEASWATRTDQATAASSSGVPAATVGAAMESGQPPAEGAAQAPSFDIVRIDPEGMAVIAGRAEPGSQVVIKEGERVIAEVTADAQGEWVALPDAPIQPGTRELALVAETPSGEIVDSESVVVLSVPERASVEAEQIAATSSVLAVLVPKESVGGSVVLQGPDAGVGIQGPGALSLDAIEYDEGGNVAIGGRAGEGERVVVYMDNQPIGSAEAGADQVWRVVPDASVEAGLHTLRVDQIDEAGTVVARIETPFSRANFQLPGGGDALVVVQPGNSLWRIARRTLGEGTQYVEIFAANRDQIADPDLIYPGQIFLLPRVN